MKRRNVLILAMLFIVMAFAVSCKNEPQPQPLSVEDKTLIDSVAANVAATETEEPDSPLVIADSIISYAKGDLNNALSNGLTVENIKVTGSVTITADDIPIIELKIVFDNFDKLASVTIKIGESEGTDPDAKIYKITEAKNKNGDDVLADIDDIVNSREFINYVLKNLENAGISIKGDNLELNAKVNSAFGADGLIKSLDANLSVRMKNPMEVKEFKYSGSAEASFTSTFKPNSEAGAGVVVDSLSMKVAFNLDIYDGSKNHTISGNLNIAFPDSGSAKFAPSFSISSFSIDGRAINGEEALAYILSKIIVK